MDDLKLNQSQVEQFLRCREQWRRVNLEKERIPPPFAMIRGTAVHAGAEANFSQKIATGVDLPEKDVVDISVDSVQSTIRKDGVSLDDEEKARGLAVVQNEVEKRVADFARLYSNEVAPAYQPTEVELRAELKVEDGLFLHGRIDWIDSEDGVNDLKTGSSSLWTPDAVASSIQLSFYWLLFLAAKLRQPKRARVELLVDKKLPERKRLETTRQRDDLVALFENVKAIAASIRAGIFTGAYGQKGAWYCSKKSCGFWSSCKFVPEYKR
jgi:hypothetical protein